MREDIMVPRKKKDGGTYWVKIGTCWVNNDGKRQLVFDALPIPDSEGRCVANLFAPRDPQQQQRQAPPQQSRSFSDDLDGDAVPF